MLTAYFRKPLRPMPAERKVQRLQGHQVSSSSKGGRGGTSAISLSPNGISSDLGALTGTVVAVDGHPVRPLRSNRFPLAIAQRFDVLIDLPGKGPYPIVAQVEGKHSQTGIILAAPGAPVLHLAREAAEATAPVDLSLEGRLERRRL